MEPSAAGAAAGDAAAGDELPAGIRLLLERLDGNKLLLRRLTDAFAEEYPQLLSQIYSALDAADAEQARRAAHTLRGAAASLGAAKVAEAATEVESAGAAADFAAARAAAETLERELERFITQLSALNHPSVS